MSDILVRAVAFNGRVRAVAAGTTAVAEELRRIHDASPTVTAALGRTATGALLLAALLEKVTVREPMLTLEIDGGGPAGRLVATASPAGWVRAFVTDPRASAPARADGKLAVAGVVGSSGHLVVTRDLGIGEPYRGVVPLHTGEIATDLAHYLSDSEQHPAAVVLGVEVGPEAMVRHAGGYLLQIFPGVSDDEAEALAERVRELGGVTTPMGEGQGPHQWLRHLFPTGFEVFDETAVRFHCGCSQERVETALTLLGETELEQLAREAGDAPTRLSCEFCRTEYVVEPSRLEAILVELAEAHGGN
jgi:molecular chaperone Hsp33